MSSVRQTKDWITTYLEYAEETEPPKSYHTWVAISLIAGCLQRRCRTIWGHEEIYPNMYVVLVGASGLCRKGTAMNIGKDLISDIGIKLVSESITREALIRRMNDSATTFTDPDGQIRFQCAMTCFSDELSVFLGQGDVKFLSDLTDWYDSRNRWRYETKGKGTDEITGVCFNLLGATAPDWLASILPQEAVGGGFTSRIIFVVEEKKGKTIPNPTFGEREKALREKLIHDLQIISNLTGVFTYTDAARELYTDWYRREDERAAKGQFPIEDARFNGYCTRRANHLRKLSMIMSVSRSDSLIIDKGDFERALNVLTAAEKNMHKTFGGLGKSAYSEATEMVIDYLLVHKRASRSQILQRYYRDIDSQTLRVVEEIMEQMKIVDIIRDLRNNEVIYEFTGAGLKRGSANQ